MTQPGGEAAGAEVGAAPCRLCGGATESACRASERLLGLGGSFDYVRCRGCGTLQIETIPEDLARFYGPDYYTAEGPRTWQPASGWRRRWSRFRLRGGAFVRALSGRRYARFEWLRRTGTAPGDPILDVGCGSGRLLRHLARDGFTHLVGIDPHWSGEAEPGPGLRFECATPETHVGRYRLVMAHHSFEHMVDPPKAFEAMARRVAPGGHLLLRVPLAGSWAERHYGTDWVQLDAPRHLFLPTRAAIALLAERTGLRLVDVVDDSGPFQIWGSEVLRRGGRPIDAGRDGIRVLGPSGALAARARARRLARAGEGDQACFYLEAP